MDRKQLTEYDVLKKKKKIRNNNIVLDCIVLDFTLKKCCYSVIYYFQKIMSKWQRFGSEFSQFISKT